MKERILKYNGQVPRYTSYPTAPHFHDMAPDIYASNLKTIDAYDAVSVYVHIPFCAEMCWYCGCHTTATRKYAPVEDYVSLLLREIRIVSEAADHKPRVAHLHIGGGSPTILRPDDFRRIMESLRKHFSFIDQAEIAIEADPRSATHNKIEAYKECGVNRASFGVQDFSTRVQIAINRVQSYATVEKAVNLFRHFGIDRLNFDLMYGLPRQGLDDVAATIEKSLQLDLKRIAFFGYAHVPWMKKHMRLIHDHDLPDAALRIDQFALAEKMLTSAGMMPVGLDHFVNKDDDMLKALQERRLTRNFQGYTTDNSPALIGLGMSSIGRTRQGFFQNYANITEYSKSILNGQLPCARGRLVNDEDFLRSSIISDLMCYLSADVGNTLLRSGKPENYFDDVIEGMTDLAGDGLLNVQGRIVTITPAARQATRIAAARFDAYFTAQKMKHAQAA